MDRLSISPSVASSISVIFILLRIIKILLVKPFNANNLEEKQRSKAEWDVQDYAYYLQLKIICSLELNFLAILMTGVSSRNSNDKSNEAIDDV